MDIIVNWWVQASLVQMWRAWEELKPPSACNMKLGFSHEEWIQIRDFTANFATHNPRAKLAFEKQIGPEAIGLLLSKNRFSESDLWGQRHDVVSMILWKFVKRSGIDFRKAKIFSQMDPFLKCLIRESMDDFQSKLGEAIWGDEHTVHIENLQEQCLSGDFTSLIKLARIASHATRSLNELAREHPTFVALFARASESWPVMAHLSKTHYPADFALLEDLLLGTATQLGTNTFKASKTASNASKWALKLVECIHSVRRSDLVQMKACSVHKSLDEKFYHDARLLPPFSKESAKEWWKVAKKALDKMSGGEPWTIPELRQYTKTTRVSGLAKNQKSAGVMRSDILKQIEIPFIKLAPTSKQERVWVSPFP